MIQFIKNHAATCDVCLADPDLDDEINKITELILPDSKIPKAVRLQQEEEEDIDSDDVEDDKGEDTDSEDDEEEEEYIDDDDDLSDEDIKAFDS